jgi:hypothetical protein
MMYSKVMQPKTPLPASHDHCQGNYLCYNLFLKPQTLPALTAWLLATPLLLLVLLLLKLHACLCRKLLCFRPLPARITLLLLLLLPVFHVYTSWYTCLFSRQLLRCCSRRPLPQLPPPPLTLLLLLLLLFLQAFTLLLLLLLLLLLHLLLPLRI